MSHDPEQSIRSSASGRVAAAARDGRLAKANESTVMLPVAQHTPGPWSLDETHLSIASSDGLRSIASVAIPGEYGLSKVADIGAAEANAYLIAAAPELLATVDWLRQTYHRAHHEGDLATCPKNTCQAALDVIAKATGTKP